MSQAIGFETIFLNKKGKIARKEIFERCYYDVCPEIGLRMIEIPKSTFWMGALPTEGYVTDECPQHEVSIESFFMSQTPITESQWRFIARLPKEQLELYPHPNHQNRPYSYTLEVNHPVTKVSWLESLEFCARLSRYTGKQYRLPTEAEWEYACRGITIGQVTQSEWNEQYNVPFHFGETISEKYANYNTSETYADELKGDWLLALADVHKYNPNAFGLYGMHGNVWEWCLDIWHDDYNGAPNDGRVWHEGKEHLYEDILSNLAILLKDKFTSRILRGGSFISSPWECCSAYRCDAHASVRSASVGFRVVSN